MKPSFTVLGYHAISDMMDIRKNRIKLNVVSTSCAAIFKWTIANIASYTRSFFSICIADSHFMLPVPNNEKSNLALHAPKSGDI